jgi:PAS domain S-box-containing protein
MLTAVDAHQFRGLLTRTIALPLVIMLCLIGGLLGQTQVLLGETGRVDHSDTVIAQAHTIQQLLIDLETGVRGYLLTGNPTFLDPYIQAQGAIDPAFSALRQLIQDNPAQEQRMLVIRADYDQWLAYAQNILMVHDQGGTYQASEINLLGKQHMDTLRARLAAFIAAETQLRDTRIQTVRSTTQLIIGGGIAVLLVLGGVLAVVGRRHVLMVAHTYQEALATVQAQAAALQASEERFRVTLASIGDAVIATDIHGRVTFLNAVAETLTGWQAADALGQNITVVFPIINEHTRHPVPNPVLRTLREGRIVGLANHTLLVARDGVERPVDDSGAPVRDDIGQLIGAVLVFRDITERKRAEHEQDLLLIREQAAHAEAQEAVRMRDVFFSVAAHELKTPLTSLWGNIQLIQRRAARDGFLQARDQHAFDVVGAQTQRLNRMVDALLDVSRLESGQLSLDRAPLDLRTLVQQVVAEVLPTLTNHTITCQASEGVLVVNGDALRLEQVLQNLIQNAVKYSPGGAKVHVQVAQQDAVASVSVTDQGIGIPQEALSRVFGRFYRASNVDEHHISGMGIGLSVVKEIVALHGARSRSRVRRASAVRLRFASLCLKAPSSSAARLDLV